MNVLIVSGIWPPDVGGPASHAPELADFLRVRGHSVVVVTTAAAAPQERPFPIRWVSRGLPKGVLHARTAIEIARAARSADVVYTTGMFSRTAAAAVVARRAFVVKLTGDPAFERARWRGRVEGDVASFQRGGGGADVVFLRVLRDATLRLAAHVLTPSAYLRELAIGWGVSPRRVSVVPNAIPPIPATASREALRASFGAAGVVLAFAGRIGPQKALDVLLDAVDRVEGVTLLVAGDGEGREELERRAGERVRFLGALERGRVLELFAAADASVLSSTWENFPHTVVESLAVGTPVLATRVGGVPEIVEDGVNGLLVAGGDVTGLAAAIARFAADDALRARLRAAAAPSVARFAPDAVYAELERVLEGVAR